MKNAIKFTVFTLLMILAFISCVPELELTKPNWKLIKDEYDAGRPGQNSNQGLAPFGTYNNPLNIRTFTGAGLTVPVKTDPTDWDILVTFPRAADILNTSNANMETELKKILQFYTYTTGSDIFGADTLGSPQDYEFIHRTAGIDDSADITIRLKAVPGRLVAKLDGNRYTYANGNKLDALGDNVTLGRDFYINFDITPAGTQDPFVPPEDQGWILYIDDIAGTDYSGTAPSFTNQPIAYLLIDARQDNIGSMSPSEWETRVKAEYEIILNEIVKKISIEKYENGKWVPSNITISSNSSVDFITGTYGEITASFTVEDLKAYHVKATGVKHLTSSKEYFGMKQKMNIYWNMGGPQNSYIQDTVVGEAGFFYNTANREQSKNNAVTFLADTKVQSDADGKNVVLWLQVNPEYITLGTDIWLNSSFNLATFKEHFKLAYNRTAAGGYITVNNLNMFQNIQFVDITAVESVTSDTAAATDGRKDTIKITLDPNYIYNDTLNSKAILISPGVSLFANQTIYHGNYGNWDREIDGIPYFGFYGNLTF